MKNAIRCCIACILPCGALDVIRIVHTNGRVEEISGTIKASEIMKAYPKHVLKRPSSPSEDGMCPKIVIVQPDDELQRGKIYFLMPLPPSPPEKTRLRSLSTKTSTKKKKKEVEITNPNSNGNIAMSNVICTSDRYLTEILSENLSTQRDRRRSRAAVWRPHLESISESPTDV